MHDGIWQALITHKPTLNKFYALLVDERMMSSLTQKEKHLGKILHDHFKYKRTIPTAHEINVAAQNGSMDADEHKQFMLYVISILKLPPQNPDAMVFDFMQEAGFKLAEHAIYEFSEDIEKHKNNPSEPINWYEKLVKRAKIADLSHYNSNISLLDVAESVDSFISDENNASQAMSSGIDWVDSVHAGGWHNGSVVVFASEANAGKTATLMHCAAELWKRGKNGLFVSYEINRHNILKRFYANVAEVSTYDIGKHADEINGKVESFQHGKLAIEYLTDGSSTDELESLIEKTAETFKCNLDFIVVDYIGCMRSLNVAGKESGLYERFGAVISDLKKLADTWKCPILTAHQLNRGGYGKEELTMANLGDSMKIAHKADAVFFVQKVKEGDNANRYLQFTLDKSRVSGCNGASCLFRLNKNYQRLYAATNEEIDTLAMEKANKQEPANNVYKQSRGFSNKKAEHSTEQIRLITAIQKESA